LPLIGGLPFGMGDEIPLAEVRTRLQSIETCHAPQERAE
jgi:hypothetical protein